MEKIFQKLSFSSASLVLILLIGIFITLFNAAKPAIDEFGLHFLADPTWNKEVVIDTPNTTASAAMSNDIADEDDMLLDEDDEDSLNTKTIYGGLVPIIGTILSTLIALLFALPIAMGIAVFLAEIASKTVSKFVGMAIELLAAIPSIIFGMWGLYYFAPIIANTFGGYQVSLLTAGLVLGVMILPFMAAITRDSMNTTPDVLKESAYALGATKFEVVKDVIFPYSKVGIIGSIILALGRALGETMAVAFLIGAVYSLPEKITDPTISIPVAMAVNFGEASGLGESALFYLGLILFVMSFIIISVAKFYFLKRVKV
ncbi:phosphate ABC transporter permease subunit PstC [Sulfurimonas autotrophica]|uniref:Phosphate transport system permease protein n=1 Tax=Sulfurimonas autotrophica (strain ATCC BAA-671 / DSM 16294 / JCM 11897 / OK10) TaxID=563040 RepID=E0UQN9_SULAO|nr:phosphate ABC transporter permease subunit PstC [Sulfurimonas autotrophica]ADN09911.1 phosphate ABC transporter membrane protein 1, PhoT family [Sulfurimonas autotrophica DSM 16294]